MRILFIRQRTNFAFPMIAAGMGTVATILHDAGHEVKVIDNNSMYKFYSDSRLLRAVRSFNPHVVAFSITIVNARSTYILLEKMKKAYPEKLYLAGGMHTKSSYLEVLEYGFDVVVNKEAESVILPLISFLEGKAKENFRKDLDQIPGVSFQKNDGTFHEADEFPLVQNLDDIPFANYDLFDIRDFFKHKKEPAVILINGQRGCPYGCTFCSDEDLRRDRRVASAEYMFNYVKYLYENFGTCYIWIADNNFFLPKERALDFCKMMVSSGLNEKISLVAQTKIETALEDDLLGLAKRAGFTKLGFGLERLEEQSQKFINKKTPLVRIHETLSLVKKHNIYISLNLILGFPFDTVEIIKKERELFRDLFKYTQNIVANVLTPIPKTIYYDQYPRAQKWHLNPKAISLSKSYFGHILDLGMAEVLDVNYFDLPAEVVDIVRKTLMEFKFYNHGAHVLKKSLFFGTMRKIDLFVAYLSKFIFRISPRIESLVFNKLKSLRYWLVTFLFAGKVSDKPPR